MSRRAYSKLPAATLLELDRYLRNGEIPEKALCAFLEDSVNGFFRYADRALERRAHILALLVFELLPPRAWGSSRRVTIWIASGGFRGQRRLREWELSRQGRAFRSVVGAAT